MEENENVPSAETTATAQEKAQEKTFTQKDVDDLIGKRLERERKKIPSEDELTAFHAWKDSQQTEQQRWDKLTGERDTAASQLTAAQAEIEQYKREKYLLSKGVRAEDADYYAFKAGKMVSDSLSFEQAADSLMKDKPPGTFTVSMTAPAGSGAQTPATSNEQMNALIRGARK